MLKQYDNLVQDVLEDIFKITKSDNIELNKIVREYFLNGGKRIRVLLLLMCAKLGNFDEYKKDIIRIASIVEIIHTASLVHDDIIDKANVRRGSATLNKKYGNRYALLVGDYLFSVVLREVAEFEDERIHSYLSNTLKELCIGELIQDEGLYNLKTRRLDYLKKIKRKTAILIAFSCAAGSIVSSASEEDIKSSYSFGYYLGMSYQIIDDYLDFAGGSEILGKQVGQDLINGNITLPALIAKQKNKELFLEFSESSSEEYKQNIIDYIKGDNRILDEVFDISIKYLKKADSSIQCIDKKIREELIYMMNILARREK